MVEITLRAAEPADLDFLFTLESENVSTDGALTAPPSRRMLQDYLAAYSADIFADKQLRLVIADAASGTAVGAVDIYDFSPRDRRGYVGIAVLERHRGLGYGLAALDALCRLASASLGMHQLAAIVAADNEASRRLFSSAGFKGCGRLRSWLRRGSRYADAIVFQKLFC